MATLLQGFLASPLVKSLTAALTSPITISTGSQSLGELYLDPLYLLPIVGVLACCFLVYAFGFKSTSSVPPTLHLLVDESERKKKDKKKVQSKPVSQANGHATAVKASPKKADKPSPKPKETVKPKKEVEPKKQQPKKSEPRQASAEKETADAGSGEWVRVLSKKEKTERKLKEEKKAEGKKAASQPKKNKASKVGGDVPAPAVIAKEEEKENKPVTLEEALSKFGQKKPVLDNEPEPEVFAEDPEVTYEASKQPSKKALKESKILKARRISESEKHQAPLSPVQQEVVDTPPVKNADKITAEVVSSYDAAEKAPEKSKAKKKKKPAAKTEVSEPQQVESKPEPKKVESKPEPKKVEPVKKPNKPSPPAPKAPITNGEVVEAKKPAPVKVEPVSIPVNNKSAEVSEGKDFINCDQRLL